MQKLLITFILAFFFQAVFSGSPCSISQTGTSTLTVDPTCPQKLLCSVQCNNASWKMGCPSSTNPGAYTYGIEISPKYGLQKHHSVSCATNSVAMKELERNLKDTAFALKGQLSLAMFLRLVKFTSTELPIVQNYLKKFYPILENQEVLNFWRETKRLCDQSTGVPIPILMNKFYTNVWKDATITEGIKSFNETAPILDKYKLLDLALVNYQKGVPLLKNWTPTRGKLTMVVEALAYLANLRAFCPCEDILSLIKTGVAPDGKGFPELKLQAIQIDPLVNFVGEACETKYNAQGCKRQNSNVLEYDLFADEEMLDLTW